MMKVVDVTDSSKISRYLDLTRFLDIVHFNRLYFRQVDKYDDVLEGCFTKKIYDLAKCITITGDDGIPHNDEIIKETKRRRKSNYVSCWALSNPESMGMWNVYGGKNGLAIQTTVLTLKKEIEATNHNINGFDTDPLGITLKVSGIRYIDHSNEDLRYIQPELINHPILLKNIGYLYENEVRFVYDVGTPQPFVKLYEKIGDGFCQNVNAKNIIEKILVSPMADDWFFDLVKSVLSKYDLTDRVFWSDLRFPPYNETDFQ